MSLKYGTVIDPRNITESNGTAAMNEPNATVAMNVTEPRHYTNQMNVIDQVVGTEFNNRRSMILAAEWDECSQIMIQALVS